MNSPYVHGSDPLENERLRDQTGTLASLLHADTAYSAGSLVLKVGCGVDAQTLVLAARSSDAHFTSVDDLETSVAEASVAQAQQRAARAGLTNVTFRQAGIFALPFDAASFDHVFISFVLEHLKQPLHALTMLARQLRPGGSMTVIEGDHGLTAFHPDSADARAAISCQIELQRRAGGNALIKRQLYR